MSQKMKQNVVPSVNVSYNVENISPNLPKLSEFVTKSIEENFPLKRPTAKNIEGSLVEEVTLCELVYKEKSSTSAIHSIPSENEYYVSTPILVIGSKVSTREVAIPRRSKRTHFLMLDMYKLT